MHEVDSDDGFKWKRARTANDTELDDAVYTWFTQQHEQGVPISGTILKAQAEKMAQTIYTYCLYILFILKICKCDHREQWNQAKGVIGK